MTVAELRALLAAAPDEARVLCYDEQADNYVEPKDVFVSAFRRTLAGQYERLAPQEVDAVARPLIAVGVV
jgi:hypothetical protein